MAQEIERKFLVSGDGWRAGVTRTKSLRQGYLALTKASAVRVRIVDEANAMLTVKSAAAGTTRSEFEYEIPVADARELLDLCVGNVIEKRRHLVPTGDLVWEVDVFAGAHRGLVIAEIELPDAEAAFERPDWLGREVTDDVRYYNASLATGAPGDAGAG